VSSDSFLKFAYLESSRTEKITSNHINKNTRR